MDLDKALGIAASGMDAQTTRLRVIAENLANQDSTGSTPGADPYRRKTITFENRLDQQLGADTVRVKKVGRDATEFPQHYDPSNPAANSAGYVKLPNVNSMAEMMDMREAERSYNANLAVMQTSRSMLTRTIGLLKSVPSRRLSLHPQRRPTPMDAWTVVSRAAVAAISAPRCNVRCRERSTAFMRPMPRRWRR